MLCLTMLVLTIVSGISASLSSSEREFDIIASPMNELETAYEDLASSSRKFHDDTGISDEIQKREKSIKGSNDAGTSISKKSRKQKAFYLNYPYMPRMNRKQQLIPNYETNGKNYENSGEFRTRLSSKKRYQQESQIYYIQLPPTPYTYVPGFGYISQPPTYSSPGLHRTDKNPLHRPSRPIKNHKKPANPFIKVPVDFVSNGKPTGVYQWPMRRETIVNRLNEGPYVFNGRPSGLYLLNSGGQKNGHQPIRLADMSNDPYY